MPDRTLILIRHAKSDWSGFETDFDRPLSKRGHRQAPEAGRWLATHHPDIDLAVVSPANRARTTWELVAGQIRGDIAVRYDERVYAAGTRDLLEVLWGLPETAHTAVLVGHNPGLEDLAEQLTGQWVAMITSAIAVLSVTGSWADLDRAALVTSGRPPRE